MLPYILAIDQGTTSSRAVIFSGTTVVAKHQIPFPQHFPHAGWVEHNANEIWNSVLECCKQVLTKSKLSAQKISALGISNQRETTIIWEKKTGKPIYPAIVWQDRRTAMQCMNIPKNIADMISKKTGLIPDPYFSATKIAWILEHVPDARQRAERGELAFGTIDTFLIWQFTKGQSYLTDATNASRTLLFNINNQQWDEELLDYFQIPKKILPNVVDSNAHFGTTNSSILGHEILISGVAGDQQAASIGQACIHPGMIKSTYGTGCFMMLNTGKDLIHSKNKLLTTVAARINGEITYALEASIFAAGTAIQWLRDNLHLFAKSDETARIAQEVEDTAGVYFVPAFAGLGAPYWNPQARAAILGITRATRAEHIVRAALEAVAYQTRDILQPLRDDYQKPITTLRVDGGMAANDWLLQFLGDVLHAPIERADNIEASIQGAAYLAGLGAGIYQSLEEIASFWKLDKTFIPHTAIQIMDAKYQGWQDAVKRIL